MSTLLDPRLADCRRVFLRNYIVDANIGIHEHEKRGAQRLALNVDLYVALSMSTPRHDKLHEVVDYDFVRLTIAHRIEQGHINLQETLVDDLARATPSTSVSCRLMCPCSRRCLMVIRTNS